MSTLTEGSQEGERLARVVLSRAAEPGDPTVASLLDQMSAREAVQAQLVPKPGSQLHLRLRKVDPVRELEQAAKMGIRFVIPGDAEWPSQLDDLSQCSLEWLGMGGTPTGLWVKGPMPLTALERSVGVVGSRAATIYGTNAANEIAAVVARAGLPIVSGAAFGIDEAAHRGAVAAGGSTVAVLACGVDRAYPAAHEDLLAHLGRHFAVVSESPPGAAITRLRFLTRNRLIAALTTGTVIVEAAIRSGALNTANWGQALNRTVMGVPGPITVAQSEGVHQWIRSGGASLVTNGEEVLEQVGASGEHLLDVPREPPRPRDALSMADQRLLEAVPLVRPADVASIARVANTHVRDADRGLRRLERAGFVSLVEQRWRQTVAGS
jgi:DNA processing protein